MDTVNSTSMETSPVSAGPLRVVSAENEASKAVQKRFDGLSTVRTKAIKGKGAWYWVHLEPLLLLNPDTGLPKAVKLRCSLCNASFSASNPSRTASEHLKRGTCPNFSSTIATTSATATTHQSLTPSSPKPISSFRPFSDRKRPCTSSYQVPPLAIVDPSRFHSSEVGYSSSATPPHHLVLSGGKEDLGPLAMLEDSVKKLKSPMASPGVALTKAQVDSAISLLADWVYESCSAISFSSVEHPKFRAFLQQVGLPPISRRQLVGARLDARYEESMCESEERIRDALFFQVASEGWNEKTNISALSGTSTDDRMVAVTVNLPNGTSVFRKAVFVNGRVPTEYAKDILWETITCLCGEAVHRCAGIVSDKFKSKALRDLENQNRWMVNLSCQLQGFNSLVKDFALELPIFRVATANCSKLCHFFNTNSQVRRTFHKYQLQEINQAGLLRMTDSLSSSSNSYRGSTVSNNFSAVFVMMEDVMASYRALHSTVLDESYKLVCLDDPVAREIGDMIRGDMAFWGDLEAVLSLVKLVKSMAHEMEVERPLVGKCLPLWNELRSKVKDCCSKYNIDKGLAEKVIEKRFKKNYHPAWSAAFILDPFYLMKDPSGKYLPPFKYLTPEQEKDVDKLITRLVSPEEAHIVLMELMKWRSEGLDAIYAQAVQMKQRDPMTGKMKVANPQSNRLVWETYLSEFKLLRKVAVRLIFLQATACGYKSNSSFLRWVGAQKHSNVGMGRAQKMVFIAANAKLERRDFSSEEEKDSELFTNGDDDVLIDVFNESASAFSAVVHLRMAFMVPVSNKERGAFMEEETTKSGSSVGCSELEDKRKGFDMQSGNEKLATVGLLFCRKLCQNSFWFREEKAKRNTVQYVSSFASSNGFSVTMRKEMVTAQMKTSSPVVL